MKELNIPITVQPTIGTLMGEQGLIGEEMASRYMQVRTFVNSGIIVSGSTDCPVVSCNPFLGMYSAITRLGADGVVWSPKEVVTAAEALIMWTKSSAYLSNDDEKMVSIEVEPDKIRDTTVLKTFLDGKLVYEI